MTDIPGDGVAERRTSPIELLWDLVFVFAVTQVTALLSGQRSWAGFGRAMLALALVWWAWSAFVWAVNAEAEDAPTLRLVLLTATAFIFISGLALPDAYGSAGILFAVSYTVVRLLHLALYADASRRGRASWSAIAGFAVTVIIGMALLIAGSLVAGAPRIVLWAVAAAIDYAGPAWLTRARLRGLQRVAVAHFAERYSLFVIICLGESIIAIGVGASSGQKHLSAHLVAVVALGLVATVGMWWTYFDRLAAIAEARLRTHHDPVLAAADGYSYLHLVVVAGVITFAAGVRLLVRHAGAVPSESVRLLLCAGVALYLLGSLLFRLRMTGEIGFAKLVGVAVLAVLFGLGSGLSAWPLIGLLALVLTLLCAAESISYRRAGLAL